MKKTLVMDIECYKNYFLVMFKDVESKVVSYFEIYNTDVLNFAAIRMILQGSRIVTFNGINYDMPMLAYALQGANSAQLKAASDSIIHQNLRSWQFEKKYSVKVSTSIDHIDLIDSSYHRYCQKLPNNSGLRNLCRYSQFQSMSNKKQRKLNN